MTAFLQYLISWLWSMIYQFFMILIKPILWPILGFCLQILCYIGLFCTYLINLTIASFVFGVDEILHLILTLIQQLLNIFGVNPVNMFLAIDNQLLGIYQRQGITYWCTYFISFFYTDVFQANFLLTLNILLVMLIVRFIMRLARG